MTQLDAELLTTKSECPLFLILFAKWHLRRQKRFRLTPPSHGLTAGDDSGKGRTVIIMDLCKLPVCRRSGKGYPDKIEHSTFVPACCLSQGSIGKGFFHSPKSRYSNLTARPASRQRG